MEKIKEFYKSNYKKLMIIPIIIFLFSMIYLSYFYAKNNDIMKKDVSLKGGITSTLYSQSEINIENLEQYLSKNFPNTNIRKLSEFGTEKQLGIIIETTSQDEASLKNSLEQYLNVKLTDEIYSVEIIGSTLGESFYQQMLKAIALAFILMAFVVFITFRNFIPSLAVVLAALLDIIEALVITNLLNITISTAGIAAFLLLIGYSIDTDILLTTRVLKRQEGEVFERVFSSIRTGLTMTITTLTALTVGYFVSNSVIIQEMFIIIIAGLVIDVINTYLMNAPILLLYLEKKGKFNLNKK